ncbi:MULTISPECIES: DUF350 domain-containing protein [unclassified Corynebacterium]|uniref:DUF350 domain-containing protein n=1 Tax=unclassified Corynebacterium TaxID=2624378 RepID=UPI0029C9B532|nr:MULTISPECIES: DUF350 domain-containing protein [unclassified Corynebacterium]WPF67283.1 DUF350 domain-containing protein [Corynebacterium sp. 22KM0430]WPF69772.1 DUF350 domain-containing protein [Corynebacterium sp. 21KM1197]
MLMSAVLGTIAYFALSVLILLVGFGLLDLLTPGKLVRLIFAHHLPNAALIASAQQVSLGIIICSAILHSPSDLLPGLATTAAYAGVGLVLQALALIAMEALIPVRIRGLVEDPRLRAGTVVVAVALVVVAAINAACMS